MNKNIAILLLVLAAGCSGTGGRFSPETVDKRDSGTAANPMVSEAYVPPMDPRRKVAEQDCSRPIDIAAGNLMCKELTAAERRARDEEEARQARARREAAERAERERLARERAALLAAEEAARKAREAEEARLAAERRRLEEEAAAKARAEREAAEAAAAAAAAAALARQRAEQEAREAAERECRRLEQVRNDGRAMLESFVAIYGKVDEFKEISGQITSFLGKARRAKPCP